MSETRTRPVAVGDALPPWRIPRIDGEKMKVLALLLRDPNPIHYDLQAAMRTGVPELVNQGPSNMAMLVNAVHQAFPAGRVTGLRMTLTGRALAGAAARVDGEVAAVHADPAGTRITCALRLVVDGADVLHGQADVLLLGEEQR